jgi:hypothetical protein
MCTTTPSPQVGYFKRKTAVLMYENGKTGHADTLLGMERGR